MSMYDPPQDEYNPYASPRAEMRPEAEYLGIGGPPMVFGVGEVLSRSWALYQSRMGFTIGVTLLGGVLSFVGQLVYQGVVAAASGGNGNINGAGGGLAIFAAWVSLMLFSSWITLGQSIVMIRIAREEQASIGGIFSGGRYLLTWILSAIVIGLCFIPIGLVIGVPIGVAAAAAKGDQATIVLAGVVAFGLGAVLAILLSVRVSQAMYLIIDRRAGAMEAINLSMKLTKGKFWSLVVIYILCFGINVLGLLALVVGLIFTVPLTTLMLAVTYASMVGKPVPELKFGNPGDLHDGLL